MSSKHTFKPGDSVRYSNSSDWVVSDAPATQPDHIVLTHDLVRTSHLSEIADLNPDLALVVGGSYTVRRGNGDIESGWELLSANARFVYFKKVAGIVKEVPLSEVGPVGVPSGPSELERFLRQSRCQSRHGQSCGNCEKARCRS